MILYSVKYFTVSECPNKSYSTDRSKAVVPVLVLCLLFPLPLGVWEGLRFVIVALPGLFSYLFYLNCYVVYSICFKSCLVLFCSCVFSVLLAS